MDKEKINGAEINDKELEQVNGGAVITDPPGPQPIPMPQPQPQPTPRPQLGPEPAHLVIDYCNIVKSCPYSSKSECSLAHKIKNCKYN